MASFKGKILGWAVMPRYLMDLETYFGLMGNMISDKIICSIGLALLDLLEAVHKGGYVFNNLKPETIMLNKGPEAKADEYIFDDAGFEKLSLHLIDFGFVTKYTVEDSLHIPLGKVETFRGNILFSSLSKMEYNTTSRKDDLISMCYILAYLSNYGHLLGIKLCSKMSEKECFDHTVRIKRVSTTEEDLSHGRAKKLKAFFCEVFAIKFEE